MKNILNRKNLFTSHSFITVVLILAIIIVINFISVNHFGRVDLTQDKQYSLSDATKNNLKEIQDPLYIKLYFSEKLPPDLLLVSQYVKDILAEYRSLSQNISLEFINPSSDPELEKEANSEGIPTIEMQILEKDEFKIQKGYLGMSLQYLDKKETIPVVSNVSNLEYELTSIINKLTRDEIKTIGFLSGHQEHGITKSSVGAPIAEDADYFIIREAIEKNYRISLIPNDQLNIINNVNTLIVGGPKTELSQETLYAIDQFIMNGGKVIFLLDQQDIADTMQISPITTGLENLVKHYGVEVKQDLVIDAVNENVGFSSGFIQFVLPYPYWPKLTSQNFLLEHPVMSKLKSISFTWVSSVNPLEVSGIETKILASTSADGARFYAPFNLDPQQNFNPAVRENIPMIIEAKGKFTSYFAGQPKPSAENEAGEEESSESLISLESDNSETINQAANDNQIIVIGDSDFITNESISRFPDNQIFFLNLVDYLTVDTDLINIRAKTITERPLESLDENGKNWLKAINIIIIPVIVIVIGLIKFYLRKRNKK